MKNWIEDIKNANNEKIRNAGKHMVIVPALNSTAPLDTYDVFDGASCKFIATSIPEKTAQEFATIWNGLVDNGESVETIRKYPLIWLIGV